MKPHFLLVEDDPHASFMMGEMLDDIGVTYDFARDGADCLERVHNSDVAYAAILMDIHMPRMTGLEATDNIRAADYDPPKNIPILAVTADDAWHNLVRAKKAGFNAVVPKPVTYNTMMKIVQAYS